LEKESRKTSCKIFIFSSWSFKNKTWRHIWRRF